MTMTDTDITTTAELSQSLTFDYQDAFTGIAAVLPHASKDDISTVINAVHITPEFFATTDRYAIGRYRHNGGIHPDVESVILPRTAAEWLSKQSAKSLGAANASHATQLRVTIEQGRIRIFWSYAPDEEVAVHRFDLVSGNYPPVGRLIDGYEPAADAYNVRVSSALLARFTVSATKLDGKNALIAFDLGKASETGKPAPIRVTIGEKFVGLLQPNLKLR